MKITKSSYDEVKKALHDFLVTEINQYIEKAGGYNQLSYALGKSMPYVSTILTRDNLLSLDQLYIDCKRLYKE